MNPPEKDPLLFIARVEYRRHAIKIARRGNEIRLLIYQPGRTFAARMIADALTNYEQALQEARQAIDEMAERD